MSARSLTIWDRLMLGVATALIVGSIAKVSADIGTLNTLTQGLARSQAVTQSQVSDVRAFLSGAYTQADAKRDLALVYRTDKDQYQRLDDHEQRIRVLEGARRNAHKSRKGG